MVESNSGHRGGAKTKFERVRPNGSIQGLFPVYDTAKRIVDALPNEIQVWVEEMERVSGYHAINPQLVQELAEDLTAVVASVVAQVIDAGSERDVGAENLGPHIEKELREWVPRAGDEWAVEENHER